MIVSRNQAMPFHFDLFFDLEEEPHFSHPLASIAILLWAIYRCIYKELSLLGTRTTRETKGGTVPS